MKHNLQTQEVIIKDFLHFIQDSYHRFHNNQKDLPTFRLYKQSNVGYISYKPSLTDDFQATFNVNKYAEFSLQSHVPNNMLNPLLNQLQSDFNEAKIDNKPFNSHYSISKTIYNQLEKLNLSENYLPEKSLHDMAAIYLKSLKEEYQNHSTELHLDKQVLNDFYLHVNEQNEIETLKEFVENQNIKFDYHIDMSDFAQFIEQQPIKIILKELNHSELNGVNCVGNMLKHDLLDLFIMGNSLADEYEHNKNIAKALISEQMNNSNYFDNSLVYLLTYQGHFSLLNWIDDKRTNTIKVHDHYHLYEIVNNFPESMPLEGITSVVYPVEMPFIEYVNLALLNQIKLQNLDNNLDSDFQQFLQMNNGISINLLESLNLGLHNSDVGYYSQFGNKIEIMNENQIENNIDGEFGNLVSNSLWLFGSYEFPINNLYLENVESDFEKPTIGKYLFKNIEPNLVSNSNWIKLDKWYFEDYKLGQFLSKKEQGNNNLENSKEYKILDFLFGYRSRRTIELFALEMENKIANLFDEQRLNQVPFDRYYSLNELLSLLDEQQKVKIKNEIQSFNDKLLENQLNLVNRLFNDDKDIHNYLTNLCIDNQHIIEKVVDSQINHYSFQKLLSNHEEIEYAKMIAEQQKIEKLHCSKP